MSKTVTATISLPKELAHAVSEMAHAEHRTRSGLIQEAIRVYIETKKWRVLQRDIQIRARHLGIGSETDVEELLDELRD